MAVMRPLPETGTSSGTPENTAWLMSMTKRGGSLIGKVVKLGFCVPTISTVVPFTDTFLMVLTRGLSSAAAVAATSSPTATTPSARCLTGPRCYKADPESPRNPREDAHLRLLAQSGEGRPARAVRAGVLDQVLDVVADLPDVVPHRQLDVAVPLHRPPQQIFAPGCAIHAPGGFDRGERVQVTEDDGHRHRDIGEALLVIVPGPVAGQLTSADPPGELLQHLAWLALSALAEQPADVRSAHAARIAE